VDDDDFPPKVLLPVFPWAYVPGVKGMEAYGSYHNRVIKLSYMDADRYTTDMLSERIVGKTNSGHR
jgi:hypothetical protein